MKNIYIAHGSLLVLVTTCTVLILALLPYQPGQAQGSMHRDRFDMWNPYWMYRDRWGPGSGTIARPSAADA